VTQQVVETPRRDCNNATICCNVTGHCVLKIVYSVNNLFTVQGSCILENCEVSTGKMRRSEASTLLYSEDGSTISFRNVGAN